MPLFAEVAFRLRLGIGGHDRHEQRAVADVVLNLVIIVVADFETLQIHPGIQARRVQGVPQPLYGRRVRPGVADEDEPRRQAGGFGADGRGFPAGRRGAVRVAILPAGVEFADKIHRAGVRKKIGFAAELVEEGDELVVGALLVFHHELAHVAVVNDALAARRPDEKPGEPVGQAVADEQQVAAL